MARTVCSGETSKGSHEPSKQMKTLMVGTSILRLFGSTVALWSDWGVCGDCCSEGGRRTWEGIWQEPLLCKWDLTSQGKTMILNSNNWITAFKKMAILKCQVWKCCLTLSYVSFLFIVFFILVFQLYAFMINLKQIMLNRKISKSRKWNLR